MQFTNATPLPAKLTLARAGEGRLGSLVAKATYRVRGSRAEIDAEQPFEVFDDDVETEHGLLPGDATPRFEPTCEVLLVGAAHAPLGKPAASTVVRMRLGEHERRILVFGDREWQSSGSDEWISAPAPFTRMPLTWDRAFGGSALVEIDREAFLAIDHPRNRLGRGYDATAEVQASARALGAPRGYPRFERDARLPNLEDPADTIRSRRSSPTPACWATRPHEVTLHAADLMRDASNGRPPADARAATQRLLRRAHPAWVLPALPTGRLVVEGCHPTTPIDVQLPRAVVSLDCEVRGRASELPCVASMIVVLPEERRFYIVYRAWFTAPLKAIAAFRLRVEEV